MYVKKGITHIYPSAFKSKFDITNQFTQESMVYTVPLFIDDGNKNPCHEKNGKPTGNCPRGRVTLYQKHYYAPVEVTFQLSDLKPGDFHAVNIKTQGAAFFQGAYHDRDWNGPIWEPLDKRYGFMVEARGDRKGEFETIMKNPVINLYKPFSVFGCSLEINLPTNKEQGNGSARRSAAIGNLGKTGDADVPMWDVAPNPCSEDTTKPHGGGNAEICKIYKSVVMYYPDIYNIETIKKNKRSRRSQR